jgi:hypothetical protein
VYYTEHIEVFANAKPFFSTLIGSNSQMLNPFYRAMIAMNGTCYQTKMPIAKKIENKKKIKNALS